MKILSLFLFACGIVAYAISQLQQHGKLKWGKDSRRFWGFNSSDRKYKFKPVSTPGTVPIYKYEAPNNWYYKLIGSKYIERWPTSTWLTVSLTDGYHLMQSVSFLCFGGSVSIALHIGFLWVWGGILVTHTATRKLLSK
jgi:hypothetical protein